MCKSYSKTCLKCRSVNTKKDGKRKWRQSYKCKKCWYIWISKRRKKTKVDIERLYEDFSVHKQTYFELANTYKITVKTVQKYLDMKTSSRWKSKPWEIILLIDTTYFWTFWLMVFKNVYDKSILNCKIVEYETNKWYYDWIKELETAGRIIKGIVCDWRRWLLKMFPDIPTQMCQFHQVQIIKRYITKRPKLKPNIELNEQMKWLTRTDKWTFKIKLDSWYKKHKVWLNEKWINSKWKSYFIHRRTRSAYRSLISHMDHLFVYENYLSTLKIPNTTNGIESVFSHLKYKVNLHRGLRQDRKIKLIFNLLKI